MKEHIKVYSGSAIVANRIHSLLEAAGIFTIIKDQVESGRLAGFGVPPNSIGLFVLKSEVEKANAIITTFEQEKQ